MSLGKRGGVFWEIGETVRIRLLTDGLIKEDKKGRRYRAMGAERYYHFARGRSWPEPCVSGDCPFCVMGYEPTKRYLVPMEIAGHGATRPAQSIMPSLNAALSERIDGMISEGLDPQQTWFDVTRTSLSKWKVEAIA